MSTKRKLQTATPANKRLRFTARILPGGHIRLLSPSPPVSLKTAAAVHNKLVDEVHILNECCITRDYIGPKTPLLAARETLASLISERDEAACRAYVFNKRLYQRKATLTSVPE